MSKCENDLLHGDEGRDWSEPKSSKLRSANKAKFAAGCKADLLKNPNYIALQKQRAYEMQCALVAKLWS